jgi:hypothetical protein
MENIQSKRCLLQRFKEIHRIIAVCSCQKILINGLNCKKYNVLGWLDSKEKHRNIRADGSIWSFHVICKVVTQNPVKVFSNGIFIEKV